MVEADIWRNNMTIRELFKKLDQEYDEQGDYFFDPVPIAEEAIREVIEQAKPKHLPIEQSGPYHHHRGWNEAIDLYRAHLLRGFGIDNLSTKEQSKEDQP
jgi:hypothetical protein